VAIPKTQYGNVPFAQAIAHFRSKITQPTERWADVWGEAHNRAFMVAGAMKKALLKDLYTLVDDAIARGVSLNRFQQEFASTAAKHGWDYTGPEPWRARVIYDTNLRQSYNAGREAQMQAAIARRPYGLYQHGDSLHPREMHLKWHDMVLPLDDPWWQTHSPSNGYGCKCKKYSLSEAELARRGLSVSTAPKIEYRDYIDKITGEIIPVPKGIDPGFDYRPSSLKQANTKLRTQTVRQQATKRKAANQKTAKRPVSNQPSPRIIDSVFSTLKGVDAKSLSNLLTQLEAEPQQLLTQYMAAKNTKTLFVKQTEMGKSQRADAIKHEVAEYLAVEPQQARFMYYSSRASRVNGFTAKRWQHIVIKGSTKTQFSRINMAKLKQAATEVITTAHTNIGGDSFYGRGNNALMNRHWSVSHRVNQLEGDSGRVLATWAHELGHQIHFNGGEIDLSPFGFVSRYGMSNHYEVFAEWFAAWLFAPNEVKRYNPALAAAIVSTIKQAIN
jgi:hypothetical protein